MYNALLNGVVCLAVFYASLCIKSDKYTESVAAFGYVFYSNSMHSGKLLFIEYQLAF